MARRTAPLVLALVATSRRAGADRRSGHPGRLGRFRRRGSAARAPELSVDETPPRWLDRGSALGGRRIALLVGIGKHSRHPLWDLPWVAEDLRLVGNALREKAGFHEVTTLLDRDVSRESVETKLREAGGRLGAKGNLLLVWWVGHGFLNDRGECSYFLPHADERAEGDRIEYSNTLGESEIAALLAPFREAGKTSVVFVADACRVAVQAPAPDRKPREVTLADATLYSTGRGRYAVPAPDQKRSAFAVSFEDALSDLSRKSSATVHDLWVSTTERMARDDRLEQRPELVASGDGAKAIKVFDRADLELGVRVVEGLSPTSEIRAAVVQVVDRKAETPDARFGGLAEGSYRIQVSRDGYIPRVVSVDLDEARSGSILEVALWPQVEILEGLVRNGYDRPQAGVSVKLEGSFAGLIRDWHRTDARTDRQGRYVFPVPPGAAVDGIAVSAGPKDVRRLPVDLSRLRPREEVRGPWVLRSYDLGTLVLSAAAVVEVRDLGLRGGDARTWEEAEKFLSEGRTEDLDLAVSYYEEVAPRVAKGKESVVRGRVQRAYRELIAHLVARGRYEEGRARADDALRDFPGDSLFEEARETCVREAIPEDLRSLLTEASRAAGAGDLRLAETRYRELSARAESLTSYYRDQVDANLAAVVETLFLDALSALGTSWRGGDVVTSVRSFEEVRRLRPDYGPLRAWEAKLRDHLDAAPPSGDAPTVPGFTFVARNTQGYHEYRHDLTRMNFVLLPGGSSTMGSPDGEPARDDDEGPVHEVELSPFLIAKHEVTQSEWSFFMGSNPSRFQGPDRPVERVSWEECREFCRKAGLRLPTEAQSEYACRGGTRSPIWSGGLTILGTHNAPDLDPLAWYGGNSGVEEPEACVSSEWPEKQYPHDRAGSHAVGRKRPNAFGLHDVLGNVWEWCEDAYDSGFYASPDASAKDPIRWEAGEVNRVCRGGGWGSEARECRSAFRSFREAPGGGDVGFRPVSFPLVLQDSGAMVVAETLESEPGEADPPGEAGPPEIPGFTFLSDNAQGYPELLHHATDLVFVLLPGGEFAMGSPESEAGRDVDEGPVHQVELSRFLIAKHEVSQAHWEKLMGSNPSRFQGPDLPVERVSWIECVEFCRKTGLELPTEAQWEYACRAGTSSPFSAGEDVTPDQVNYHGEKPYGAGAAGLFRQTTVAVDSLEPNSFGLHHMHGNVWEWCRECVRGRILRHDRGHGRRPRARAGWREPPLPGRQLGGVRQPVPVRVPSVVRRDQVRHRPRLPSRVRSVEVGSSRIEQPATGDAGRRKAAIHADQTASDPGTGDLAWFKTG